MQVRAFTPSNTLHQTVPASPTPFDPKALAPDAKNPLTEAAQYTAYQPTVTGYKPSMNTATVFEYTKTQAGESLRDVATRVMADERFKQDFKDMSVEGVMTLLHLYNEENISYVPSHTPENLVLEAGQELVVVSQGNTFDNRLKLALRAMTEGLGDEAYE